MPAEPRGRHRRRPAWPRAWVLSLAVLLIAGAFGIGHLVSQEADGPAEADTPAIIRPSADTADSADQRRRRARGHGSTTDDSTPSSEPNVPSTTPDVRALRTSRRDTGRASTEDEQPDPRPTATATEDPTAEPTGGPTSDPSDEPSDQPSDEPSDQPSDEPTGEDDDGDLLPLLPDNGSDRSREVRSPRSSKKTDGNRQPQ